MQTTNANSYGKITTHREWSKQERKVRNKRNKRARTQRIRNRRKAGRK